MRLLLVLALAAIGRVVIAIARGLAPKPTGEAHWIAWSTLAMIAARSDHPDADAYLSDLYDINHTGG